MPFQKPTLQEVVDRIEQDMMARIDGASSMLRRSILRVLARIYAGAVHLLYGYLEFIKDQLFATKADTEFLELHGSEYGITRKSATNATGTVIITGTAGILIPTGTQLESPDGKTYETTADATISGAGLVSAAVISIDTGQESNQSAAVILTFISPIIGVTTSATIDLLGITGGVDEETDDDLRDRILQRKRIPPYGGTENDYEQWALEIPGVTRAWAIPGHCGVGTVGFAFVKDNDTSIIPDAVEKAEVYAYLKSHVDLLTGAIVGIPVTAETGLSMIDTSLLSINMTILLSPNNATTRTNVTTSIEDLILMEGGPGEVLYLSSIYSAVVQSGGVIAAKIIDPATDYGIPTTKIPVIGTITFGEYI